MLYYIYQTPFPLAVLKGGLGTRLGLDIQPSLPWFDLKLGVWEEENCIELPKGVSGRASQNKFQVLQDCHPKK